MKEKSAGVKIAQAAAGLLIAGALAAGAWILIFHSDWFKAAADDEDDAEKVPPLTTVRVGKIGRATLRRFVEGYGTVEPQPAAAGTPSASARVASPVAGIVAEVRCVQGQKVARDAVLFQLDERAAAAEEEKAAAAVASAQASLAKLRAFPRPEQLRVAELTVDRARMSVDFAQKKHARVVNLAADQLASAKAQEEAEQELAGARSDLAVAEKQLLLLRSTPAPEEVEEARGKVVEAQKALQAAQAQRSLLKIRSPLAGSVLRVRVNPGEAVDLSTPLAEIADTDRLVVEGTLPAASLASVATGMGAEVSLGGEAPKTSAGGRPGPHPNLLGKVSFVALDLDRKTDSGLVRIALGEGSKVLPGQFVRFRIAVEEHKDCLVVPRECVVRNPDGKPCIVGFLGEKAVQKEVRLGLSDGPLTEISGEDLDEGDPVVTQGAYGLPEESKVKILKDK